MFARMRERAQPLKAIDAVKVALPQDEFNNTDLLCGFINEFDIDIVFSVAPESEWKKIYGSVNRPGVKFYSVLTGYLDEGTIKRVKKIARSITERPIDVGYRGWYAAPWAGRHGLLKAQIFDLFKDKAPLAQLRTDLSTDEKDTLLGDEWYRFLLRCKYTISVEGGASIWDRDGTITKRTDNYLLLHPGATFEEVEEACFPNMDGSLNLVALSPRHLEACLTRTCQILVAGKYNGILKAGEHYLELKRDFSNIDVILNTIKRDHLREEIIERAYQDIVGSGRYTYRSLVEFVLNKSLEHAERKQSSLAASIRNRLIFYRMWWDEAYGWLYHLWLYPSPEVQSKLGMKSQMTSRLMRTLRAPALLCQRLLRYAKGL